VASSQINDCHLNVTLEYDDLTPSPVHVFPAAFFVHNRNEADFLFDPHNRNKSMASTKSLLSPIHHIPKQKIPHLLP
jgi:hypothetical protein